MDVIDVSDKGVLLNAVPWAEKPVGVDLGDIRGNGLYLGWFTMVGPDPSDRERVDGRLSVFPNVVVEGPTLLVVFELDSLASLVEMPGLEFTEAGAVVLKDQDSNGEWWR